MIGNSTGVLPEFEAFAFTHWPKNYVVHPGPLYASLTELTVNRHGSMTYSGRSISFSLT